MSAVATKTARVNSASSDSAYRARLRRQAAADNPAVRKRDRTRARLKLAAVDLLSRHGYHGLTITGIVGAAGVAAGTFYTHFTDRKQITLEVLTEFLVEEVQPAAPLGSAGIEEAGGEALGGDAAFVALRAGFRAIVPLVRHNAGLFRVLYQLKDEDADVLALWKRVTDKWAAALAQGVRGQVGPAADPRHVAFLAQVSSAMADEILFRIFVEKFAALTTIADDDEGLSELLAVLRYRLLFAANPSPALLNVGAPLGDIALPMAAPRRQENR